MVSASYDHIFLAVVIVLGIIVLGVAALVVAALIKYLRETLRNNGLWALASSDSYSLHSVPQRLGV